ncbi:hypothetical protein K435DRAFT_860283 [Dendrothele bispora CBS 962.96]|uniref:Uncharacterized protein n=1 Tax=Dendrothele bispora (strain CBS 962.96) TaxID=1314807 RepID=A0A4S8LY54_DENBC|nr:hypothetical protein K435DRAFT_860283 [Dendrothele bispora CBS 962.96]
MQQTSDNSVVSIPFTSNKIADRDFHCERKDCKRLVHAGEAQGWFKDPMERWKRVCAECKVIYDARAAATTRQTARIWHNNNGSQAMSSLTSMAPPPPPPVPTPQGPDPCRIAQSVNAAQKSDAPRHATRVTAIGFGGSGPQVNAYPPLPAYLGTGAPMAVQLLCPVLAQLGIHQSITNMNHRLNYGAIGLTLQVVRISVSILV